MRLAHGLAGLCVLALSTGCGSSQAPRQQVTQAKSSIRAAEAVGAQNYPQAALHLKMARDQVYSAEQLIRDDENRAASLVLQRAEADAELAMALAREQRIRYEAQSALQRVQQLRTQMQTMQQGTTPGQQTPTGTTQ